MANIKLNYTAFTSASMALKITAAMAHCLSTGEPVRIDNRRGKEFLLLHIAKDRLGYTFRFYSMYDHAEVGDLILRASHSWPDSSSRSFWEMNSTVYDLTEHPLITERKRSEAALQVFHQKHSEIAKASNTVLSVDTSASGAHIFLALQQRTKDQIHKQAGATHKATDSLGRVVYLSYKRTWFGLGKTKTIKHVLEVNSEGLWDEYKMKVNGESFTIQGVL